MIELHNVECLEFMRTMPDNSVDAIVTDPPYFGVKDDDWDNQWKDADAFIAWIGELSEQWQRILKPNGSLYCFASPQMSWGVEGELRKRFNVLCNVRWQKPPYSTKAEMFRKEDLRSYFTASETIIFAEQFGADNGASDLAGYDLACQQLRVRIFQVAPLAESKGVTRAQIAALIVSDYKNPDSAKAQASNWILGKNIPNETDFNRLRTILPIQGEYEDLRQQYEDLRQQYEDLRREYEDLRRPFNVTADVPYTDVWTFRTVQAYDGKHVCEKPIALMEHIILASTKPDAIVFDPFMGSGSTGVACVLNGRSFIGCEMDLKHFANASARIRKHQAQPRLFDAPAPQPIQLTL